MPMEVAAAYRELPDSLDYNVDVRPVLSDRCWSCHGPDAAARKAGLRLDDPLSAYYGTEEHGIAIIPGNAGRSQLVQRILSHDPEFRMPTPESNLTLSPREKAVLVKWIEQGARYDPHWAFVPLTDAATSLEAERIDDYVRRGYADRGLEPNGPATPRELVRRVYRDLTGLPPSLAQTNAFVANPSEAHYQRLVDSLLASDACAEQLTLEWLDVARYADSHGLHADGIRTAWPWRDWVIDAFRQNMPYDRFVTEQIAGDLLPDATDRTILATAFNRNHPMTAEGGADHEEFRVQYVMDRTNTFSTAFLGLTLECAACHDHKFDPVSQTEYYQLSAFFNNVPEFGMTGDDGDYGPLLMLADESTRATLAELTNRIVALETAPGQDLSRQAAYIEQLPKGPRPVAYLPLDSYSGERTDGYPTSKIRDTLYTVPGVRDRAYYFDNQWDIVEIPVPPGEAYEPVSASVYLRTDKREPEKWQAILSNAGHKNSFWRGLEFQLTPENYLNFRLVHSLPGQYIEVQSTDSIRKGDWTHVAFTYDGSSSAEGVTLYLNGKRADQEIRFNKLYRSTYPVSNDGYQRPEARPYRLARAGREFTGEAGIFRGAMDEFKLFDRELSPVEMAAVLVKPIAPTGADRARHTRMLAERAAGLTELRALRKQRLEVAERTTDVMVMADLPEPRQAYRLERGVHDLRAEAVDYGTPRAVLDFDSEQYPKNRLGLARWLFAEENPLTARVTANRYWQFLMGRGIVGTAHDFGMQGDLPTHPALLDYLANGLRDGGWNIKSLLRAIVLSDTYRLRAAATAEQRERDPDNAYYARSSAHRYRAENIRDYVLAVSGLLVDSVGGPSVKPYQPPGLWLEKSSFSRALYAYEPGSGEDLYRRSMYTFIRRTSPPPNMLTLDQPSRDRCTVTRESTNTPLQALVLLNDPQFVEAARVLAQRVAADEASETEPDALIERVYARALGRRPGSEELAALHALYERTAADYAARPEAAEQLLAVGEYDLPPAYDPVTLASLTVVSNTILNHDEVYTRR